jgi:hypothetical protein
MRSCQASPRGAMIVLPIGVDPPRRGPGRSARSCRAARGSRAVDFRPDRQRQPVVDRRLVPGVAEMHLARCRLRAASTLPPTGASVPRSNFGRRPITAVRRFITRRAAVLQKCARRSAIVDRVEGGVDLAATVGAADGAALHPDGDVQRARRPCGSGRHRPCPVRRRPRAPRNAISPPSSRAMTFVHVTFCITVAQRRRCRDPPVSAVDRLHEVLPHVGDHAAHGARSRRDSVARCARPIPTSLQHRAGMQRAAAPEGHEGETSWGRSRARC